jgi:outer membrane protein OmpA-like peptidoglycan-associated protein
MKNLLRLQALRLVLIFSVSASSLQAAEYYVVIGTFAQEVNARNFTSELRSSFTDASYSFHPGRQVYYVYVLRTPRKDEARGWTSYLRTEKGFKDAWVLTSGSESAVPASPLVARETNHFNGIKEKTTSTLEGPVLASAATDSKFVRYTEEIPDETYASEMVWINQGGIDFIPHIGDRNVRHAKKQLTSGHVFKFIVEDSEGKIIPAEVMLVDFEKIKKIAGFNNGEHAAIRGTRRNQMVALVCDVLGFKPETRMYNIDHLSRGKEVRKNKEGIWEVRFRLRKMEENDFSFMNKTSFYKDAAVMQPSSEKEVEALLSLMNANPGYKIIIHSHCNPGEKREIKVPDARNFFGVTGSSSRFGSDRRLTKERAATLRNYLLAHGIDKKRIDIIGWGSKELLAKPASADSEINERIEVELADDGL